jgi:hypothetical protein
MNDGKKGASGHAIGWGKGLYANSAVSFYIGDDSGNESSSADGSFQFKLALVVSVFTILCLLKGTVRRDLRGVENRLKRSVLINCKTASLYYLILKGHHHKRRKN